jgi:hypothetical protein
VEELNRSKVDVQVQTEPQPQQDVAGMLVARHPRVAKSAEEDGVHIVAEVAEGVVGEGFLGLEEMLG